MPENKEGLILACTQRWSIGDVAEFEKRQPTTDAWL